MVTVGVLVRTTVDRIDEVRRRLDEIPGVSTLPLEDPASLGAVLEAPDLDEAHDLLRESVERVPGVLAAWPVHTEMGAGAPPPGSAPSP